MRRIGRELAKLAWAAAEVMSLLLVVLALVEGLSGEYARAAYSIGIAIVLDLNAVTRDVRAMKAKLETWNLVVWKNGEAEMVVKAGALEPYGTPSPWPQRKPKVSQVFSTDTERKE